MNELVKAKLEKAYAPQRQIGWLLRVKRIGRSAWFDAIVITGCGILWSLCLYQLFWSTP